MSQQVAPGPSVARGHCTPFVWRSRPVRPVAGGVYRQSRDVVVRTGFRSGRCDVPNSVGADEPPDFGTRIASERRAVRAKHEIDGVEVRG